MIKPTMTVPLQRSPRFLVVLTALAAALAGVTAAPASGLPIDTGGFVGAYSSMTIGSDGLGLISYRDGTNGDLKVAHCLNIACTAATTTAIDTYGNLGEYTSLAIGSDGLGLISYFQVSYPVPGDDPGLDLKVAHCLNIACTAATITAIDTHGDVGRHTSMTIGSDGLGLISYWDGTNGNLKVAHCLNIACTAATTTAIDTHGRVGAHTSIKTGTDGLGLISYYYEGDNFTGGDLKVAHCLNVACTSATTSAVDTGGDVGLWTSLAIGSDDLGLISYYDRTNGDLKVAHCLNVACTATTAAALDTGGAVGQYTSLAIGNDGLGLISYHDRTNGELNVAHCSNVACSDALTVVLDPRLGEQVGRWTSITIGNDGLGLISYYNLPSGDLNVAHCSSPQCLTP